MDKLSSRHYIFIILGTCIVSYKTYPNILLRVGKRDSWIAVLIASFILILYLIHVIQVSNKTNSYNIYEVYTSALGDNFGKVFYILFTFTMFLTLIEAASMEANSMHQNMLLETPTWFLLLFFIPTTAYSVKKGIRPLVTTTLIGITFVMLAGINLGVLTQKYKDNKYLYPILQYGFDKNMIIATLKAIGMYGGIAITFPFLSEVSDKKQLLKNALVGVLIVIQMEIYSTIGIVTTFGYKRATTIFYPKLIQTQMVSHFDFLESGELFVMLQILGGWYMKYALTFYGFLKLIEVFYKGKKNNAIWVTSILVFFLSYYASRNGFLLFKLLDIYNYIVLVNFIIIPAMVYTVYSARASSSKSSKGEKNKSNNTSNKNMTNKNASDENTSNEDASKNDNISNNKSNTNAPALLK